MSLAALIIELLVQLALPFLQEWFKKIFDNIAKLPRAERTQKRRELKRLVVKHLRRKNCEECEAEVKAFASDLEAQVANAG